MIISSDIFNFYLSFDFKFNSLLAAVVLSLHPCYSSIHFCFEMARSDRYVPDRYKEKDCNKEEESKDNDETRKNVNKEPLEFKSAFMDTNENNTQNYFSFIKVVLFVSFLAVFFLIPVIAYKHRDPNNLTLPFD